VVVHGVLRLEAGGSAVHKWRVCGAGGAAAGCRALNPGASVASESGVLFAFAVLSPLASASRLQLACGISFVDAQLAAANLAAALPQHALLSTQQENLQQRRPGAPFGASFEELAAETDALWCAALSLVETVSGFLLHFVLSALD